MTSDEVRQGEDAGARGLRRGAFPVVIRPTVDPTGETRVLLQLPDGFMMLKAVDARQVAALLVSSADEVDGGGAVDGGLPEGVVVRLDVMATGVVVNARDGMSRASFVDMLRMIADAYEAGAGGGS